MYSIEGLTAIHAAVTQPPFPPTLPLLHGDGFKTFDFAP